MAALPSWMTLATAVAGETRGAAADAGGALLVVASAVPKMWMRQHWSQFFGEKWMHFPKKQTLPYDVMNHGNPFVF